LLAFGQTVLLLGGLTGGSWRGLCVALGVFGAWVASMALGGSTPTRNRIGLASVAGVTALLAARQLEVWIAGS
jgi:hypothetical protein